MTKSVRAELNRIERFLLKGGTDAIDLWNIMSALRGPDDINGGIDDSYIKENTTAPIRTKAFPNLSKRGMISVIFASRGQKIDLLRKSASWHFNAHVSYAAQAISRRRARKQRRVGAGRRP